MQGEQQVQTDESVSARLPALRVSEPPVRWEAQAGESEPLAQLSAQGQPRAALPRQRAHLAQRALLEVPLAQPEPAALRPLAPCQHERAAPWQTASSAPLLLLLPWLPFPPWLRLRLELPLRRRPESGGALFQRRPLESNLSAFSFRLRRIRAEDQ